MSCFQNDVARKNEKISFLQDEITKLNDKLAEAKSELTNLNKEYDNCKLSFSTESRSLSEKCSNLEKIIANQENKVSYFTILSLYLHSNLNINWKFSTADLQS